MNYELCDKQQLKRRSYCVGRSLYKSPDLLEKAPFTAWDETSLTHNFKNAIRKRLALAATDLKSPPSPVRQLPPGFGSLPHGHKREPHVESRSCPGRVSSHQSALVCLTEPINEPSFYLSFLSLCSFVFFSLLKPIMHATILAAFDTLKMVTSWLLFAFVVTLESCCVCHASYSAKFGSFMS